MPLMNKPNLVKWVAFIMLSFIWGSSFILMKVSKEDLNGIQIGALRILSAGLIFIPFSLFHMNKIPSKKLPLVLLSGFLGSFFPAFFFAIAIDNKIDSALAGILNSLTPLLVIVLGVLFFKAKLPVKKIAGVLIGFIGLLILSLSEGGISLQNFGYASLILLATLFYAINVNMVSVYLSDVHPRHLASVSLAFMSIPAAITAWNHHVFSIIRYDASARLSVAAAILLGIVGTAIATLLFYYLIKKAGALFASLVTYGIPVVAIFWGIIAGEHVSIVQVACLLIILGGVYIANNVKRP